MNEHFVCKIADFGLAKFYIAKDIEQIIPLQNENEQNEFSSYTIGTPLYRPPEFVNAKIYDQRADVFSLGLIYFEMLNNFKTMHQRYKVISELRNKGLDKSFIAKFPLESKLLELLIQQNFECRPTSAGIYNTEQFKDLFQIHQTNPKYF